MLHRLKLKYVRLHSSRAFNHDLRPYIMAVFTPFLAMYAASKSLYGAGIRATLDGLLSAAWFVLW